MSETWLKENPALLEYVSLPGYGQYFETVTTFAVVVLEHILAIQSSTSEERISKVFNRIWNNYGSKFRDEISIGKALIGVIYRSERVQSPSDWLDSFESLLGYLTVSWDGLLLVTGDINIDLLKPTIL